MTCMEHYSTVSCMYTGTGHDLSYYWFFAAEINLQNLCLEKLSNWLKSTSDIDTLPLPAKLKIELKRRLFGE